MHSIPDPGFAGDEGGADVELASALADYDAQPGDPVHAVLLLLQHSRLLVPVVAGSGEVEYDAQGLARDKTSDMATVLTTGRDGRMALLAFTSLSAMRLWNHDARPVPVPARQAAAAAVQDHAHAMVVDIAGPVMFVVEEADLRALAEGLTLARTADGYAWARSR